MRFIRDDIRVRDLDKRYKKVMRLHAQRTVWAQRVFAPAWCMPLAIPVWRHHMLAEQLSLKGA